MGEKGHYRGEEAWSPWDDYVDNASLGFGSGTPETQVSSSPLVVVFLPYALQ